MTTARESIPRIVGAIQGDPRVKSVLVGGSIRSGTDDEVSDLDLWVQADDWSTDCLAGLLVAGRSMIIGDNPLFHGCDSQGVIVDICHGPKPPDYYSTLDRFESEPWITGTIEAPSIYTDFWINSYKHRKPIWRDLDAMALIGLHYDRLFLIQAWVELDTGAAPGPQALSIHGLTPIVRNHITPARRELLGLPTRTRRELVVAIDAYRCEMQQLTPPDSLLPGIVMTDPIFIGMARDAGI